jgi:hypothetical protein
MKYILKVILILLILCNTNKLIAQITDASTNSQDSIYNFQEDSQNYVDVLIRYKEFNLLAETHQPTILSNENELKQYFSSLIKIKYPEAIFSTIYVSEDKTKKIWFAYTFIENSFRQKRCQIIVCKENGKILKFELKH